MPTERAEGGLGEQPLAGGVANAGAVVRVGDEVRRPSNPHTATIHEFLLALHEQGFDGVPRPIGFDVEGRERLRFVPGDVAVPPFPAWARSDAALASLARLLRRFHAASRQVPAEPGWMWNAELADPEPGRGPDPGTLVCHNDVCWENVVFRAGEAVALLDLDYAAPGRAVYDVAQMARMCVPVDDPESAQDNGWRVVDAGRRLRIVADEYGLPPGRDELFEALAASIGRGGEFVLRHVRAGEPGFVAMWDAMGGMQRFDRRRAWFAENRDALRRELG